MLPKLENNAGNKSILRSCEAGMGTCTPPRFCDNGLPAALSTPQFSATTHYLAGLVWSPQNVPGAGFSDTVMEKLAVKSWGEGDPCHSGGSREDESVKK